MKKEEISVNSYSYDLPAGKIPHHPLARRSDSKLLVYKSGKIQQCIFSNLADHLPSGATVLLNDTKVIEARLFFTKPTGGIIEIFCLEPYRQSMDQALQQESSVEWQCLLGGASKWKPGLVLNKKIAIKGQQINLEARYAGKLTDAFLINFSWNSIQFQFADILHAAGEIPLPPYFNRSAELVDKERYQTIFARKEGSVAAPTAALHFTEEVFQQLQQKQIALQYVTLNVGAGTFKPVKVEKIGDHEMHSESFTVKRETLEAILEAKTIVAVGTTSLRTIESLHWLGVKMMTGMQDKELSLSQWEAYDLDQSIPYRESISTLLDYMMSNKIEEINCRTSLLIVPGYRFQIPAALITNFHQPQSTLLLLVAAFVGEDWKKIYQYALDNDFRFLSYGDSSLLWTSQTASER